jgi:hypothetical protein
MTLGAGDRNKVIALCVLGAIALYAFYTNVLAGPSVAPRPSGPRAAAGEPTIALPERGAEDRVVSRRAQGTRGRSDEFHPVYLSKRPEERPDPSKIDPTLKMDLLAKVQGVDPAGGTRNLFQVAPAPPKEAEKPKGPEPKVFVAYGPQAPEPPKPPAPPPPPTPVPYKFYGFSTTRNNGKKTAYFLDGDDILIAGEGDTLKRRYKVVRIGPSSVLVEDTESKRQQTVPLTEESQS